MVYTIRRLSLQRARRDCVGIAPSVQQEEFVLHVRKFFGVEGHSDKVEAGVEPVDLDGIFDIVCCRAIAIVIGILAAACGGGNHCGHWIAAQDIGGGGNGGARAVTGSSTSSAQITLLCLERCVKGASGPILPWAHVKLPDHAHLQVLGRRDMTVPEVS